MQPPVITRGGGSGGSDGGDGGKGGDDGGDGGKGGDGTKVIAPRSIARHGDAPTAACIAFITDVA